MSGAVAWRDRRETANLRAAQIVLDLLTGEVREAICVEAICVKINDALPDPFSLSIEDYPEPVLRSALRIPDASPTTSTMLPGMDVRILYCEA